MVDLALGLVDEGVSVEFVTGIFHKFWREELSKAENNITLKEIGKAAQGNVAFWMRVKGFARELSRLINPKTDVILTSGFPSSLSAEMFSKRCDVKVVHYLHEAPMVLHDELGIRELPLRFRMFYRFLSALYAEDDFKAVRRSDMIIANSRLSRRANAKTYCVEESQIRVVYPGVNVERMTPISTPPEIIKRYGKREVPIIFFPKGAQFWMNQDVCLMALRRIRVGDYVAVFTGGKGQEVASLFKKSRTLGLEDKIIWVGELTEEELRSIYSHSSLVVSLPKRQPFGLIPLEALACGVPPIISSQSGVAEVLRENVD
ncbi:glycosyltransferase family 4 protein, partial [Candidatus Bathyarchaeota archaeon]|nr:glycosyltransferase family 4 protein [Candidatus Bathyarchaeota archaeon]